ncbi:hypothetical protein BJ170DRAFT_596738 [Xylariales sp. AK1849]|nr:hypothetical protein BJ170DRAFT_596738 [Xylariales sp. AK1849]
MQQQVNDVMEEQDPFEFLKHLDTVFLIDDSESMILYWGEVASVLRAIVPLSVERDTNGIDIYFGRHKAASHFLRGDGSGYRNIGLVTGLLEMHDNVDGIFDHVRPRGKCKLAGRLREILNSYMQNYEAMVQVMRSTRKEKPMNLIVITANVLNRELADIIGDIAKRLDKLKAPSHQVGIQFFQVGDDERARVSMQRVDGELHSRYNVRDIVDTVTWTGETGALSAEGILKAIGGGMRRSVDKMVVTPEDAAIPSIQRST